MYKLDIYDEDNSITLDDEYLVSDTTVYPETKRYEQKMHLKEDVYYRSAY